METEPRDPKPMNTPSPLVPQGSLPDSRGKSHIRIAVFSILAVHAVLLGTLLIFGCKKAPDQLTDQNTTSEPTNAFPSPPPQMAFAPNQFPEAPPVHAAPPSPVTTMPTPEPPPAIPPVTATAPPSQPQSSDGAREHVVLKGESFYTIAKKYGISSRAIGLANPGVDSTRLRIGQKLVIPSAATVAAAQGGTDSGAPAGNVHTVKAGENLTIIARRHSVSVKDIQVANNLRTTQIRAGQKLKIPERSTSGATDSIPPLTPASSTSVSAAPTAIPQ